MRITLLSIFVLCFCGPTLLAQTKVTKIGIIGLDTSHVSAFSKLLNDPKREGMKVVAAFPGGSPDIESSHSRVAGFTAELKKLNVEMVDSIPDLISKVDAILLESVDGRPHLAQALPVLKSGKPMFIDKPLAGTLADAIAIDMLAKKYNARWFSSSSLRFAPSIYRYRIDEALSKSVRGADAWSPCSLEKTHPDLFWYGVHGVEVLYTIMGEGCETVTRTAAGNTDLVVGVWKGGRVGTFRGIRDGKADYGAVVFGDKSIELAASTKVMHRWSSSSSSSSTERLHRFPTRKHWRCLPSWKPLNNRKRRAGYPSRSPMSSPMPPKKPRPAWLSWISKHLD